MKLVSDSLAKYRRFPGNSAGLSSGALISGQRGVKSVSFASRVASYFCCTSSKERTLSPTSRLLDIRIFHHAPFVQGEADQGSDRGHEIPTRTQARDSFHAFQREVRLHFLLANNDMHERVHDRQLQRKRTTSPVTLSHACAREIVSEEGFIPHIHCHTGM